MGLTLDAARALARRPGGMDATEATAFLDLLLSGRHLAEEGASLLVSLAERGETGTEVAAFVCGLIARSAPLAFPHDTLDVCGTGGSGLTRYNVSTTSAFILAAGGVAVAKHGNRGSTKPNGSFDLLDALGVSYGHQPEALVRLQRECRLCFLFARTVHPAVAAVAPYRKAAGRRTIFNLAGPLANPARPARQIIGVINARVGEVIADAARLLAIQRALVVWGGPGIDELSVTGESHYRMLDGSGQQVGVLPALHPGLEHEVLPGGLAQDNAEIFRRLITGEETGPLCDMVAVNAGAAFDLWEGRPPSIDGPGVAKARRLLADGTVRTFFDRYRALAAELSE